MFLSCLEGYTPCTVCDLPGINHVSDSDCVLFSPLKVTPGFFLRLTENHTHQTILFFSLLSKCYQQDLDLCSNWESVNLKIHDKPHAAKQHAFLNDLKGTASRFGKGRNRQIFSEKHKRVIAHPPGRSLCLTKSSACGRLWQFAHPRPLSLLQSGLAPRSKGKARAKLRPARCKARLPHSRSLLLPGRER